MPIYVRWESVSVGLAKDQSANIWLLLEPLVDLPVKGF